MLSLMKEIWNSVFRLNRISKSNSVSDKEAQLMVGASFIEQKVKMNKTEKIELQHE